MCFKLCLINYQVNTFSSFIVKTNCAELNSMFYYTWLHYKLNVTLIMFMGNK